MVLLSLITRPRHKVKIYPAIQRLGADGGSVATWMEEPIELACNVQSLASDNLNRTASVREEYYGETVSTSVQLTANPGTFDRLAAALPEEARDGFPVNALVVFDPGQYVRRPWGTPAPTGARPLVYVANAREVVMRMGINTQHDKLVLARGNDVHNAFLDGKL